jgi:MFS family permease
MARGLYQRLIYLLLVDEVAQLNWIISAFNLTSAAFIPFWGQMADIFGRHMSLQACIVVMMIGSALCTAAPTSAYPVLLLGRGLQGLGCAGIGVIVRVILADKVSLKENAKNWSIFSFTAGISYGIGPVIGGNDSSHDVACQFLQLTLLIYRIPNQRELEMVFRDQLTHMCSGYTVDHLRHP